MCAVCSPSKLLRERGLAVNAVIPLVKDCQESVAEDPVARDRSIKTVRGDDNCSSSPRTRALWLTRTDMTHRSGDPPASFAKPLICTCTDGFLRVQHPCPTSPRMRFFQFNAVLSAYSQRALDFCNTYCCTLSYQFIRQTSGRASSQLFSISSSKWVRDPSN